MANFVTAAQRLLPFCIKHYEANPFATTLVVLREKQSTGYCLLSGSSLWSLKSGWSRSCSCLTRVAVADSWFYPAKFAPFLGPEPRAWEPVARAHKPGKGLFTVERPAPPPKSWLWTTVVLFLLLPLATSPSGSTSMSSISSLCPSLSPLHLTSGSCRLLQCFAACLCEGWLDSIMFNCVYPCLGEWGNFCSRSTASCGLGQHKAKRDNVCPWANVYMGKEAHLNGK